MTKFDLEYSKQTKPDQTEPNTYQTKYDQKQSSPTEKEEKPRIIISGLDYNWDKKTETGWTKHIPYTNEMV